MKKILSLLLCSLLTAYAQQKDIELPKYVEAQKIVSEEKKPNNFYILFQEHHVNERHHLSKEQIESNGIQVSTNQVSSYRIAEYLHRKKGLQVIVHEGIDFDNLSDVTNPKKVFEEFKKKGNLEGYIDLFNKIDKGDDVMLMKLCRGVHGAHRYGVNHEDVFLLGFEEPTITDEAYRTGLNVKPEELDSALSETSKKRAANSVKYSLSHVSDLDGKIKSKDILLVTGYSRAPYYQEHFKRISDAGYNPIIIVPKGISKQGLDFVKNVFPGIIN